MTHSIVGNLQGGLKKNKLLEKVTWYKQKIKRDAEEEKDLPQMKRCKTGEEIKRRMEKEPEKEANMTDPVKAVMFIPFTVGSGLAKKLKEAEEKMQSLTGYWLKMVERAGKVRTARGQAVYYAPQNQKL